MSPSDYRLPRLLKILLRPLADADMLASIEEDLGLRRAAAAADRGRFRAGCVVIRHIVSLVSSLALEAFTWRMAMLRSYLKTALRQIFIIQGPEIDAQEPGPTCARETL